MIAIASAFPLRGNSPVRLAGLLREAIDELRSLHLSAGSHLTELLISISGCGRMLFEPSDTELAVDLGIGSFGSWRCSARSTPTRANAPFGM